MPGVAEIACIPFPAATTRRGGNKREEGPLEGFQHTTTTHRGPNDPLTFYSIVGIVCLLLLANQMVLATRLCVMCSFCYSLICFFYQRINAKMNYFVIFVVKYFHDFYFASILIDFLHSSKLLQVKIALFNMYKFVLHLL